MPFKYSSYRPILSNLKQKLKTLSNNWQNGAPMAPQCSPKGHNFSLAQKWSTYTAIWTCGPGKFLKKAENRKTGCDRPVLDVGLQNYDFWASIYVIYVA